MAIITIASNKGGVGKSTLAYHLSGAIAQIDGGPVLLVDCDENRSVVNWRRRGEGELGFECVAQNGEGKWVRQNGLPKHTIRDMQARPSPAQIEDLVEGSDVVLVPTTPDALAMDVLDDFISDLKSACQRVGVDVPYAFILTIIDTRTKDGADAREFLTSQGQPLFDHWMRQYNAYRKAADQGCLVKDARASDGRDRNAGIAWNDCMAIANELLESLEDA